MSWPTFRLAEIADLVLGKMLDQKKNRGELAPYLANVNVRWGNFDLSDLREMRFEPHEKDRYGVRRNDIVMCEGGEPGRCAIWRDQVPGMMLQKALHRIRARAGVDPDFLYFSLSGQGRAGQLEYLFTGATIKHLPSEQLAKVEVRLPPLPTQRRIASILGAYDDLIEVNRRRIAVLEEMARRLFEEWFVQFRFPGSAETRSRSTGLLPSDWRTVKLSDVCSLISRGISPTYDDSSASWVIGQKCIRDQRLTMAPARRQRKSVPEDKLLRSGDVMINSTGVGTLGRVAQVESIPSGTTVDSHVTIVRARTNIDQDYFGLSLLRLQPLFESMGAGATGQTELNRGRVAEVDFVLPSEALCKQFGTHVRPMRLLAHKLAQQTETLASARDLLLPRLISGELEVKAAERELEVVA